MCEISKQKAILLTQSIFITVWFTLLFSQQEKLIDKYQIIAETTKKVDFEFIDDFRIELKTIPIEFQSYVLKEVFEESFNLLYGNEKKYD